MRNLPARWFWGVVIVAAAVGLGSALPDIVAESAYAVDRARASASIERLEGVDSLSEAFSRVAEVLTPSVVSISSVRKVQVSERFHRHPFENSPFRDFFGDDFFDRFFNPSQRRGFVQQGIGTGVIVSEDGHILTNNHVVHGADEVTVKLSDDRDFTAEVVGSDPKTDLAVLKIDADDLHPAKLGDSDALRVGEWVVAAGNPFGLSASITTGIVSAKGRANVGISDYEDFIQTDAAINPGNSGGPLTNLRGEVVGINTAIFSRSGGYMGIGFAIPINMARSIMQSLITEGRVVRGYLGVTIQNLNEELARSFGFEGTEGALVGDVVPDGPADKAGFESGDIVVEFDGSKITDIDQLRNQVAATKPGTEADVVVFRNGEKKRLSVTVGELESEVTARADTSTTADLGMTVRNLTPDIRSQLGYEDEVRGVVVTQVEPLSAADRAGLRVRDVIVSVQGRSIDDVSSFRSVLGEYGLKDGVRLGVLTEGMRRFVFLKTG